jgi:NCAIR mutase (PurE)-related protein
MKTFKINFKDIPNALLKEKEGELVLTLDIPSLTGRKRFYLKDGDEIEATDQLMEIALSGYACPKLPVTRISKEQKEKYKNEVEKLKFNKDGNLRKGQVEPQLIPQPVFYDVADVKGKKPFTEVF